jgi:hypothetical protein
VSDAKKKAGHAEVETKAIGFFEAFALPNVISYAGAFGFFKLVSVTSVLIVVLLLPLFDF